MSSLSPAAILHNTSGTEVGTATDPLVVKEQRPTVAGDTVVTVNTTSVQVVAANAARKALLICNCDGNRTIYLRFGATAATTNRHAVRLPTGATYEVPHPAATVAVQAIASGNGGILLVQEFT